MAETPLLEVLAQRVTELPPLPKALVALMQLLRQDDFSVGQCVALIERDQALAARMLRLANSAFYGVPGRVGSIGDAVRILGVRTVWCVLTAAALHQQLRADGCPGFRFEHYWRHTMGAALAARGLALLLDHDPDEAFLAGLLHDVGQLVMATFSPEAAAKAIALAKADDSGPAVAESAVLGFDHAELGALVSGHWHFPPTITRAIALHHMPEPAPPDGFISLSGLVHVADSMAHALDLNADEAETVPPLAPQVWVGLPLSDTAVLQLLARTEEGVAHMSAALQGA